MRSPQGAGGDSGSSPRTGWTAWVGGKQSTIDVTNVETHGDEGWTLLKRNFSTFIPIAFEGFKAMGRGVLLVIPDGREVYYISGADTATAERYDEIREYLEVHRNERMSRLVETYDPARDVLITVAYGGKGEYRLYVLAHAITLLGGSDRLQ